MIVAIAIAISPRAAPLLALAGVAVVALLGLWRLVTSSARRSALVERGGIELAPPRTPMQRLDARIVRRRRGADLAARLHSAGVERSAAQFITIVVLVAAAAFLVIRLLLPLLFAIAGGLVGWWACFFWLRRRLDKRREEFIGQLPEVARLLSNGASAGLSVPAAIELAVREIEDPARGELRTVVDELSLGRSLDQSLEGLTRRLPSREIAVLMGTVIIQQRAGGDTVSALRELSETLDNRRENNREVRTLMAGAVYTAYLVPFLGLGSLLMLNTINPHTLQRMTSSVIGIVVLLLAAIIYMMAFAAIRRVTRIET